MRKLTLACLTISLLAGNAIAQVPPANHREDYLAYVVAAASAEGDLRSDLVMVNLLNIQQQIARQPDEQGVVTTARELALRAEADVLHAQLSARLSALSMDDPDVLAADIGCWSLPDTPERCAERRQRLQALAGDNAYHHMMLMITAWKRGEAENFLEHARDAAASGTYRSPISKFHTSVHRRFKQIPDSVAPGFGRDDPALPRAGVTAMALSATYPMPAYQNFSQPCREAEGELRGHCLSIALMQLEASHTWIEIFLAAAVVEALGTPEERALAQSMVREAKWQMQQMGELSQRQQQGIGTLGYEAYFEEYGRLGELPATRALLEANGFAVEPPPKWTPPL